jgi:hypothetical protein
MKRITWARIQNELNIVVREILPLATTEQGETSIEDWLSNAATDTNMTPQQVAREWDKFNSAN